MNFEQWTLIETVLDDILLAAPAKRQLKLAKLFGEDEATLLLARRVVQLTPANPSPLPAQIGPWRPVLSLGRSLNSTDYLVRNTEDDSQPLAILHRGDFEFADDHSIQSFRDELKQLDSFFDPGYCRIVDAGLDDDFHPYIVNDFLAGIPLLESVRDLDTRSIVQKFLKLLGAVEHAHSRHVVHGDFNPAHILLSAEEKVLLPGFAIGRILGLSTRRSHFVLNPNLKPSDILYYCPEQLQGQPIQQYGDIYSLGVILYQMLSGTAPYGNRDEALVELAATIIDRVPSPIAGLDETLNLILKKALHKDPSSRYSSLAPFSSDLHDYLNKKDAPPPSPRNAETAPLDALLARGRQHWVSITLGAAVFVTAGVVIFQSTTGVAEAGQILRKTNEMMAGAKTTGRGAVQLTSVQQAKTYLDGILAGAPNNPQVQRELSLSYLRLAEAELKGLGSAIIDRGLALQASHNSYDLSLRVLGGGKITDELALEYAHSARTFVKLLKESNNYNEAIRIAEEWQTRLSGTGTTNIEVMRAHALAYTTMADLLYESGQQKRSLDSARLAMTEYEGLQKQNQDNPQVNLEYAASARNVGVRHLALNQPNEAIQVFQIAATVLRKETDKPRPAVAPLVDLATTLVGLGEALEVSGQAPKAMGTYLESRRILEQASERDSANEEVQSALAANLIRTAKANVNVRNPALAVTEANRAIELLKTCLAKLNSDQTHRRTLARAYMIKAEALAARRLYAEAKQAKDDALLQWQYFSRTNGLNSRDKDEIDQIHSAVRS